MEAVAKRKHRLTANKRRELLTYICFLAWPTIQFLIFYVVVNANSILLAFQEYDTTTYSFVFASRPFENLKLAFAQFFTGTSGELGNGSEVLYSLLFYACSILISVPLGLMFSYYIYKKFPCSGFFRIILFLPQIVSSIVTATLYCAFVKYPIPELIFNLTGNDELIGRGLLETKQYAFWTVLFYNVWSGFGANILMYSNKMSTISNEVIEAANIDGATGLKEFWHIVLPQVYPTLCVFLVSGVAGIFVNQWNLVSLYPNYDSATIRTFGYYFFFMAQRGSSDNVQYLQMYPYLSAMGLVIAIVIIPIVFALKKVLAVVGPSEK